MAPPLYVVVANYAGGSVACGGRGLLHVYRSDGGFGTDIGLEHDSKALREHLLWLSRGRLKTAINPQWVTNNGGTLWTDGTATIPIGVKPRHKVHVRPLTPEELTKFGLEGYVELPAA